MVTSILNLKKAVQQKVTSVEPETEKQEVLSTASKVTEKSSFTKCLDALGMIFAKFKSIPGGDFSSAFSSNTSIRVFNRIGVKSGIYLNVTDYTPPDIPVDEQNVFLEDLQDEMSRVLEAAYHTGPSSQLSIPKILDILNQRGKFNATLTPPSGRTREHLLSLERPTQPGKSGTFKMDNTFYLSFSVDVSGGGGYHILKMSVKDAVYAYPALVQELNDMLPGMAYRAPDFNTRGLLLNRKVIGYRRSIDAYNTSIYESAYFDFHIGMTELETTIGDYLTSLRNDFPSITANWSKVTGVL